MLKQISIKNYALAEDITVAFESGLNVITGETGAGKSIIISALGLLLGNRASKEIVRTGTKRAIIEGLWDISNTEKIIPLLIKYELDIVDELFIRREVTDKGTSRALINDAVVPLSVLYEIAQWLVDLHGQHQHQLLLNADNHIQFYDDVVLSEDHRASLKEGYANVVKSRIEFSEMRKKVTLQSQQQHVYQYEFEELKKANLVAGEWEKLEHELKLLENAESISRDCHQIIQLIDENDISIIQQIHKIRNLLVNLGQFDQDFMDLVSEIENTEVVFSEIQNTAIRYKDSIDFDSLKIEDLRQRYLQLKSLQKKFDKTYEELLSYYSFIDTELNSTEGYEEQLRKSEQHYQKMREEFGQICGNISQIRQTNAEKISREFEGILSNLGMTDSRFQVRIWREETNSGEAFIDDKYLTASEQGIDNIEFFISPNPGEDYKPLAKIASGGEISRIMLAIKTILASSDRIPSLVFDEIDAGISGQVATTVGKSMKELAQKHQIICITHLPQITAFADFHFKVSKYVKDGRTYTEVKKLNESEKVSEIADLIGGKQKSAELIKTAEKLIQNAN